MNWLDKLKGKGGRPDGPAAPGEDKQQQGPDRDAGGTVVRAAKPATTIAKPGIRFHPNYDVTVDLQIKSLLGSGGMGEVYLARQRLWDVDIALKIPNDEILSDPENRHRIVREAEAWTDLGLHPNIAYCYYAQHLGELLLLVIEYADGGNLRGWIADGRCADLRTGLDLAIQFCHGLEHAHKKGLVHRDIKPENVLLMKDGTLKITDFGIVHKALAGPETLESTGAVRRVAAGMTTAGIGTPDYMAPEQWGDQGEIDLRADIFAFGICLYEMLCGGRPYPITTGPRQEAPDPGRMRGGKGLPERLCRTMKRCVDWDRDQRPESAKEVREEICRAYEEALGEPSLYAELPEIAALADDWNNRALSYLALGRPGDAEKAWHAALEADPLHPVSTYNYGLFRWRDAKATDEEVLFKLRAAAESDPSAWLPRYLVAQVHLERGDVDGAREELSRIGADGAQSDEVGVAARAAEHLSLPTRLIRVFADSGFAALSGDGQLVLSAGLDGTYKLRDVATEGCRRTFAGRSGSVGSVFLSADGGIALLGRHDVQELWDVARGQRLHILEESGASFGGPLCLSADGRFALTGTDGSLKLWEVPSGRCALVFANSPKSRSCGNLGPNGKLALLGAGSTFELWETNNGGRCIRTFEGHTDTVCAVHLSADARLALSGSFDGTVKLWDVAGGQCLRTFGDGGSWVESVCLSTDKSRLLSGNLEGAVRLYSAANGRCLRTLEGHVGEVLSICISSDGRYAMSSGRTDGRLWQIGTFEYGASFRLARLSSSAELFAANARYRAAIRQAGTAARRGDTIAQCQALRRARGEAYFRRTELAVREWANLYPRLRRCALAGSWLRWKVSCNGPTCVHASSGGHAALVGNFLTTELWEMGSGVVLRRFKSSDTPRAVYLSDDGNLALSGFDDRLELYDARMGRLLKTFAEHSKVSSVCLSTDGRFVLSGAKDKALKVWDVESGRCLRTLEGHTGEVESVSLSADGRFVLSGGRDNLLKLWRMATGRCLMSFEGHSDWVFSVSLSGDGRYALSGSRDKTLKLWETASGRCLQTFEGHAICVSAVGLSFDGRFAISGGADKSIRLWDVKSGLCLRTLMTSGAVGSVSLSRDCQYAIAVCGFDNTVSAWFLDWDLDENASADWDEGARSYLETFLRSHQPYAGTLWNHRQPNDEEVTRALTRQGRPRWSDDDFKSSFYSLGCAGYGWLRPEGVRRELERMTRDWKDAE